MALVQRHLHMGSATPARQPCRNDPGVVHHQQVAGAQQAGQIAHPVVRQARGTHRHQPRDIARASRPQRDQVLWQVEVEVGSLHQRGAANGG